MSNKDDYHLKIEKLNKEYDDYTDIVYFSWIVTMIEEFGILINTFCVKNELIRMAINTVLFLCCGTNVGRSIVFCTKAVKSKLKADNLEKELLNKSK